MHACVCVGGWAGLSSLQQTSDCSLSLSLSFSLSPLFHLNPVRNVFVVGTLALFAPALAVGAAAVPAAHALAAIWAAKALLNVWRCACAGWFIARWAKGARGERDGGREREEGNGREEGVREDGLSQPLLSPTEGTIRGALA